jgi:hypothetical protein
MPPVLDPFFGASSLSLSSSRIKTAAAGLSSNIASPTLITVMGGKLRQVQREAFQYNYFLSLTNKT